MNNIVQNSLDQIEAALNALVDSLTSYNPSITAATNLLLADDELTDRLDQCEYSILDPSK